MIGNIEMTKLQIKKNIVDLIDKKKFIEAKSLLEQYKKITKGDPEVFSIEAVISINEGCIEQAICSIEKGLKLDNQNFDLLYNLAYLFEAQSEYDQASALYAQMRDGNYTEEQKKIALEAFNYINNKYLANKEILHKKKIVFFVKEGMDTFLNNIIRSLSEYDVKKVIVKNYKQIDDEMLKADICWFEWCDELIVYASNLSISKNIKIICRLHSYEAFVEYPSQVNWANVDKVIFVAEHIKNFVLENVSSLQREKALVIPNGIELENYNFKARNKGFNIAYLGYINYKKGPMMLLHVFKAIYDKDSRYKLFIAGAFQDPRYVLYFRQMIKELGLENNVFYEGWQENVDQWLENKHYILSTSVLEGHPVAVMQAMAKGIKPLIHNFVGARAIYPKKYVWNTFSECISLLSTPYDSREYRNFIANTYTFEQQINQFNKVFSSLLVETDRFPLVTVGIINYNNAKYLSECVESFTNQNYPNLEIIIIDDLSTDGSQSIISNLEKKHKNIRSVLHKVNSGGPSKATQEIISLARGKYIQWISSDDYVMPGSISKFVDYLEMNPQTDYVYSNFNIVNQKSEIKDQWVYQEYEPDKIVSEVFHTGSGVLPTICLFKTEFFRKNDIKWLIYRKNDLHSDTLNSLQFLHYKLKYKKLDEFLICYRIHDSNISYSLPMRIRGAISIFDYIIKHFNEAIYLPEINWDRYESRNDARVWIIADFYYQQAKQYLKKIPDYIKINDLSSEEINSYIYPFIREAYKYIYSASKQNKYIEQINNLEKLLGEFEMFTKIEHIESIKELGNQVALLNKCLSDESESKKSANQRQRIGYVDFIKKDHLDEKSLIHFHKNVFSQAGQDGILEEIFSRLNLDSGLFVEFGGWDGIYLSNARYLALQGWSGVFIEADPEKFKELQTNYKDNDEIIAVNKFVEFEGENKLDEILHMHGIKEVDFLSIDIDGLDYKILESLVIKPKVILMEGGASFSPFLNVRVPDQIAQNNLSQSLPVLLEIADKAGYATVCFFQDLYLVRKDLANKFTNYNGQAIKLYREWFLSLPEFNQNYMVNYVRRDSEDCTVKLVENDYFKIYSNHPLGYSQILK